MKDKAQRIMKTIEDKLKGQMGKHSYANLPISPSGQVDDSFIAYTIVSTQADKDARRISLSKSLRGTLLKPRRR